MFGIGLNKDWVLCHYGDNQVQFQMRHLIRNPVMVSSASEVDNLLQKTMVSFNMFHMYVIEFTPEEEAAAMISRLKGY